MKKLAVLLLLMVPVVLLAGDRVPFKVTESSISFQLIFPNADNVFSGKTERCASLPTQGLPPGTGWGMLKVTSVGESTLMGRVVDVESGCTILPTDPSAPPPPVGTQIPFLLGDCLLTAANGDTVHSTYYGFTTVTESGMLIDGTMTTVGGTGRFAGVTGSAKAYGVQTATGANLTIVGTLDSVGSLK